MRTCGPTLLRRTHIHFWNPVPIDVASGDFDTLTVLSRKRKEGIKKAPRLIIHANTRDVSRRARDYDFLYSVAIGIQQTQRSTHLPFHPAP